MAKRLPIPVRRILREPFNEAAIEAATRRVHLTPRPRSRFVPAAVGTIALAAVIGLVVLGLDARPGATRAPSGPLRLEGGTVFRSIESPGRRSEHGLEDGSRVALAPRASIEALVNDSSEVVLLARGTITFDVRPGGPRRWTIECGLATVVVVGTRFTVEQSAQRLRVSVARGTVLVRSERVPERVRRLGAGEDVVILAEPPPLVTAATAPTADEPSPPRAVTTAATVERARDSTLPAASTRWRNLAASGAWERAYAELGAAGIVREAPRAGVDELLALADVARLSGHPSESVGPLERIIAEHPNDPNAALAAFTLGRVEFDQLRRPDRAARAFDQALALGLPAPLRPDALARLARAHGAAGHAEEASRAAARYLADYPNGAQSAAMRALVGVPQ